jgi:hypothetical protein
MFLDIPVDYTINSVKNEGKIAFQFFIKKNKSVSFYAENSFVFKDVLSSAGYTNIKTKRHTPTPTRLKKAMFKMSSKGIVKSLLK